MTAATLELKNMTDFDRRRSAPVDISSADAITAVKAIKPGMALSLDTTSALWELTDADKPFMLAAVAGDRLDVLSAGAITVVPLPSDEFLLDSFAYVGSPAEGDALKISTGADVGKWVVQAISTVAHLKACKLTVVKAAGSDGKITVRPIK